jgi:hypothetical protein
MGREKSRGRRGKVSRFKLGREGELALAAMGLIFVVGAVVFFGWTAISKFLIKPDPAKVAAEQALKAGQESRWVVLLEDGTVQRADEARKDLFVDAARWERLGLSGRTEAAAAATDHFEWKQCFIYDASTGDQIGWYTRAGGYKQVEKK